MHAWVETHTELTSCSTTLPFNSTFDKQQKILLAHFVEAEGRFGYRITNMARRHAVCRGFGAISLVKYCCKTVIAAAIAPDAGTNIIRPFVVGGYVPVGPRILTPSHRTRTRTHHLVSCRIHGDTPFILLVLYMPMYTRYAAAQQI